MIISVQVKAVVDKAKIPRQWSFAFEASIAII
jgi:hypothetical protein